MTVRASRFTRPQPRRCSRQEEVTLDSGGGAKRAPHADCNRSGSLSAGAFMNLFTDVWI